MQGANLVVCSPTEAPCAEEVKQYSTVQYGTVKYSAVQYSTVQYCIEERDH